MTTRLGPPKPVEERLRTTAVEDTPDTVVGQRAESTWVKKIIILIVSVAGGLALWSVIWTMTNSYSMPKWLCIAITIAAYSLILYLVYKGINYVKPEKKGDYPAEALIAICVLCILFQLVNNYLREDNFTPTGQPRVFVDPTTNEKWYGEHPEANPRTGVKLVLATPEMLAKAEKPIVCAPQSSGRIFSFPVPAKGIYTIDGIEIKKGQEFTFLTYDAPIEFRVRNGEGDCWERVKNNLPWNALQDGILQIRAGNMPANITLNIKI